MKKRARRLVLNDVIDATPRAAHFRMEEFDAPAPASGEILVRTIFLSLDPYIGSILRGRHMGERRPGAGDCPPGRGIGEVVASSSPLLKAGDLVRADLGWSELSLVRAEEARLIHRGRAPLSAQLGVAGMPGLTAYAGLKHLAKAREGDHVLISSAAGAVGGAAGQIARILGAERVVGIAGSAEKCALVTNDYGYDACINYKTPDWKDQLKVALPHGADIYFDNVGGDVLQTALLNLALYGRIVLCGLASQYQADERPAGPNPGLFIAKRAQVFGLVVYDYEEQQEEFTRLADDWIASGRLTAHEDRAVGLEQAPAHFERLMLGENIGKAIVVVGRE
jgi:NADPH-dependent curcumin reductase CurA